MVKALLASGNFSVRAVTRDVSKPAAQALKQDGAEPVAATFSDVSSLEKVMDLCHLSKVDGRVGPVSKCCSCCFFCLNTKRCLFGRQPHAQTLQAVTSQQSAAFLELARRSRLAVKAVDTLL